MTEGGRVVTLSLLLNNQPMLLTLYADQLNEE